MLVTLFKRPNGESREIDITKIRDDDAAWFIANGIAVSMEDCGFDTAVYADCGFRMDDDATECPDEIVVLAEGKTCEETMAKLREACEEEISSGRIRFEPKGVVAAASYSDEELF